MTRMNNSSLAILILSTLASAAVGALMDGVRGATIMAALVFSAGIAGWAIGQLRREDAAVKPKQDQEDGPEWAPADNSFPDPNETTIVSIRLDRMDLDENDAIPPENMKLRGERLFSALDDEQERLAYASMMRIIQALITHSAKEEAFYLEMDAMTGFLFSWMIELGTAPRIPSLARIVHETLQNHGVVRVCFEPESSSVVATALQTGLARHCAGLDNPGDYLEH